MSDNKTPLDVVSIMEQFSGVIGQMAMVEGTYFIELVKNGIPSEIAADLVRDWHNMYWQKQFYPNGEE